MYDCDLDCIDRVYVEPLPEGEGFLGDGYCDDNSMIDEWTAEDTEYVVVEYINFNCEEFDYDDGDCLL